MFNIAETSNYQSSIIVCIDLFFLTNIRYFVKGTKRSQNSVSYNESSTQNNFHEVLFLKNSTRLVNLKYHALQT